jgi:chemotaxis protein MotB
MNDNRKFRKFQKKVETEKDQSERWLLTYSDMITLLLGLFIVMYSISNVDSIKLQTVASSIRGGFGLDEKGQEIVLDGSQGLIQDQDLVPKSQMYRLWERIQAVVKKVLITDKIMVKLENKEELTLTIPASSLGEGNVKLPEEADAVFIKLQEMDRETPLEIIVRVQIPYLPEAKRANFENNWEYNAHRASYLAKEISSKYGIPESRISVQGMSEFQKLNIEEESLEDIAKQERFEVLIRKK